MGAIDCRLAGPDDYEALRRLWDENTDWGVPSEIVWNLVVEGNPAGRAVIVVAEAKTSGDLVGQLVLLPATLLVRGRVRRVVRAFAPIVVSNARGQRLGSLFSDNHPFRVMLRFAIERLGDEGFDALYGMPNPRFVRFFRALPGFHLLRFPLYSRPFADPTPELSGDLRWAPYEPDDRLDELAAAASYAPVHLERTADLLRWRGLVTGQRFACVEDDAGQLRAVVAARAHGDRQWQIEDIVAPDDHARRAALIAAIRYGHAEADPQPSDVRPQKAAILAVPSLQDLLATLGFVREHYEFPLITRPLGAPIPELAVPDQWYLSAGD